MTNFLLDIERSLPAVLYRNNPKFCEYTGVKPETMSTLDSKGLGPSERIYNGNRVGYPRQAIMSWLVERFARPHKNPGWLNKSKKIK